MRLRGAIGRFLAVGLLPALLLTGAVPGWTHFLCSMSGEAYTKPCCPEAEAAEPVVEVATIGPGACCLRIETTLDRAEWVTHTLQFATLPAPVVTRELLDAPLEGTPLATDERAVMDTGPPIRLRTQTFLI